MDRVMFQLSLMFEEHMNSGNGNAKLNIFWVAYGDGVLTFPNFGHTHYHAHMHVYIRYAG